MKQYGVLSSVLFFFVVTPVLSFAAPNNVYMVAGTRVTFTDSTGTGTAITLQNLGAGAGRYSTQYNKGTGAQPYLWMWDVSLQMAAAPAIGDTVEFYVVKWSSSTIAQGGLGTTNAPLGSDKRKNISLAGTLVIDQNTATPTMIASGYVEVREQFLSVSLWNGTTVNLVNTANANVIGMTPYFLQIQAGLPLDYDRHPPVPALALAA